MELEHYVVKFKQFLPKGMTEDGGIRDQDIIQFWSEPPPNKSGTGGLRTVAIEDLTIL